MTSEIIWTGEPDDQTCRIGDYVLRVEEGNINHWWWEASIKHDLLDNKTVPIKWGYEKSEEEAKTAAINAMKEHAKKTKPPYNCPSAGKCIYPECGCEWNL